jgi:hypothetical protein
MRIKEKWIYFFLVCCICFVGIIIYAPYHLYFLADDFFHIPYSAENIWLHRNSIRPIGNLTLQLDYFISYQNPLGYHFTNLILHIINSVFVGLVTHQLFKKFAAIQYPWLAFITAIFFFVYPFHSETVFWIIGRSGSLGALFTLTAMYVFLIANHQWKNYLLSSGFFILALFSYESSWVLPIIISLMVVFNKYQDKHATKPWYFLILIWLLFIGYLFLRIATTGELFNQYDADAFLQINLIQLAQNFVRLFIRTWLPPMVSFENLFIAFSVVLVVILLSVYWLYKKKKFNKFFVLLSVIWLLSYLPYLSIGIDTHGVEGERYLYLPSVFFCCWFVYVMYQIFSFRFFNQLLILLMLVQLGFLLQSRKYYLKAGTITQQTLQAIHQLADKEKIFIENLPQYNKGAVVFRVGLNDAVKWLYPQQKNSIYIVSKDSSDIVPKKNYVKDFFVFYAESDFPKNVTTIQVWNDKMYVPKDTANLLFVPHVDAWLSFTDSSLTIR